MASAPCAPSRWGVCECGNEERRGRKACLPAIVASPAAPSVLDRPLQTELDISGNEITNLEDVNLLRKYCPDLTRLDCRGNPMSQAKPYRSLVLRRLHRLTWLDGMPVRCVARCRAGCWPRFLAYVGAPAEVTFSAALSRSHGLFSGPVTFSIVLPRSRTLTCFA